MKKITGNRWYNQVFKFWIWEESKGNNCYSKTTMAGRKIMVRTAKRRLKQLFKKEVRDETSDL